MKQRCDICGKVPSDQTFRRVARDPKILWICINCWYKNTQKKKIDDEQTAK